MEIISTHDSADFDALASLVAAQKLYASATMVLTANLSRPVRDFLALHKRRFVTLAATKVDSRRVTRWILVDVRRAHRLRAYAALLERAARSDPGLDIHIYDHHLERTDDVPGSVVVVEPVGSTTTLLVERIAERGIAVDPVEATLFALGIHTDTGSLLHAGATPRDARALAWVMAAGARLAVINRYLEPGLRDSQREALRALLASVETRIVSKARIGFAAVQPSTSVEGMDEVASHLLALGRHAAVFVLVPLPRDRIQVIARSREGVIDVARALQPFDGGGHAAAASATIKRASVRDVCEAIATAVGAQAIRILRVRDVMTAPVHTISPQTSLAVARASLATWGHSGLPVVDASRVVGVLSERDLPDENDDSAARHAVAGRMRRDVMTAHPDESIEDALERMTTNDVGRLPVLDGDRLVGIVTRADLIHRALYAVPSTRDA